MSKNGFDFSGFRSLPVEREFFPMDGLAAGEGVTLQLNLDLLTLEKMDQLEIEFNAIFDEILNPFKELEKDAEANTETALVKSGEAEPKPFQLPKFEMFALEKAKFSFFARVLAGAAGEADEYNRFIHSWNVTKKGKPVPITYESFLQMPPHGLARLYRFCVSEANNPTASEKKQ
ncbi:hypothetical protein BH10ACI2_BH10ACI2_04340 [soil metagenome]